MSVTSRPAFSILGRTSDRAGMYPPGKIYLAIHGLVAPGPSERPIECSTITPSSASSCALVSKEGVEMIDPDMLEHSDRHDAIERAGDIAIVLQPEAGVLAESFFGRPFVGDRMLFL